VSEKVSELIKSTLKTNRPLSSLTNNLPKYKTTKIHTIPLTLYPRKGSRGISEFSQRHPRYTKIIALKNIVDVTGGKLIAVWSQSISGVIAIYPLVTFCDIHEIKREELFFFVPNTTRDTHMPHYAT
jgi:hypothetical protein